MSDSLSETLREAHARFAALVESLRPELHRYCSRMTGSVLDGEDVVQEALAQAFYGLALRRDEVAFRPWLFTIAHHKCVDFLRRKSVRRAIDMDESNEPEVEIEGDIERHDLASQAFSRLVLSLPPRERAALILKDLLGYELPEIASILGTSIGAVKAALHRGRGRVASDEPRPSAPLPDLAQRYMDSFNRRDWVGLGALLEDDVELELVGFVHRHGREAIEKSYVTNYAKLPYTWRLAAGTVDGEPTILCLREEGDRWVPCHAVRLEWRDGRVSRVRDYVHVEYLFNEGRVVI